MSEAQKKITVCLCAYNAERFIAQAVESILAQTYTNWELYVVNDTSIDATAEIVKRYLGDPRVKLVNLEKNIGTYAAKNLVLKNFAAGEYWVHHDADDYSEPDRFEKQIAYLREQNLDGCGTAIDELYAPGLSPRIPSDAPLVYNKEDGYSHRVNVYPERVTLETVSVEIEKLPQLKITMNGSLFFKLDTIQALGGFDGHTHTGGDSDLLWRFSMWYAFGNMPDVLYHRRFHPDSLTQSAAAGWDSPRRKQYAEKALAAHFKRVELLEQGLKEEAKKESTYDFFYPEVKFEVL